MTTIALVTDLIFSNKITGTGKALDRPVAIARSLDKLYQLLDGIRLPAPTPLLFIVDLNATGPDPLAAIAIAKSHRASPYILAYVSHTQADLAASARAAGAHQILARSAFVEKLPILLHSPPPKPLQHSPPSPSENDPFVTLDLPTITRARQAATDLLPLCTKYGFSDSDLFAIQVALEEAFLNAFHHGNKLDPAKTVRFQYHLTKSLATFVIEDQGEGFDPAALPDPTADQNLGNPSGRGILLMRAYMTSVTFSPVGNKVTMTKNRE